MMKAFCGMVGRQKAGLKPRARFEPVQNLESDFFERSFAVVITITPWSQVWLLFCQDLTELQQIRYD